MDPDNTREEDGSSDLPVEVSFTNVYESSDFDHDAGPDQSDAKDIREGQQNSADENLNETLPQEFNVRYLGKREAAGLWGIRYTRKPVDSLVAAARELKAGSSLPYLRLKVTEDGVLVAPLPENRSPNAQKGLYPIHAISYGVQDLVYTRVFAMIVVRETADIKETHPFMCHGFVCDSRLTTRRLTFALATAFKIFSNSVKAQELKKTPKKFAIDLRPSEEIEADDLEDVSEV